MEEMKNNDSYQYWKPSLTNEGLVSIGKILERKVRAKKHPVKHSKKEFSSSFKREPNLNETTGKLNEYSVEQCYSGNAISDVGKLATTEITAGEIHFEKIIEQKSHFLQELNSDSSQVDSCSHDVSTDENQDEKQNIDQVAEARNLTTMAASSPERAKKSRQIEGIVSSNKEFKENTSSISVTSGDVKLHDRISTSYLEIKDASNIGNDSKVITNQQTLQARNGNKTEETIMDSTTSPQSSFVNFTHGDLSYPGPSLSGPITTSSHIPYSGSISLRSDSSTTSARSFAFPILQSEWNSSPIKMAKAERRHLKKHRWRTLLICCKF